MGSPLVCIRDQNLEYKERESIKGVGETFSFGLRKPTLSARWDSRNTTIKLGGAFLESSFASFWFIFFTGTLYNGDVLLGIKVHNESPSISSHNFWYALPYFLYSSGVSPSELGLEKSSR